MTWSCVEVAYRAGKLPSHVHHTRVKRASHGEFETDGDIGGL
jgi:hypothetical protein